MVESFLQAINVECAHAFGTEEAAGCQYQVRTMSLAKLVQPKRVQAHIAEVDVAHWVTHRLQEVLAEVRKYRYDLD